MLTEERAREYRVESSYGLPLDDPAFKSEGQLWRKEGALPRATEREQPSKRFEFSKIGKTLGLQIKRYISVQGSTLFYYDSPDSDKILGYCQLENVYAYFLRTEEPKYVLYLTNGTTFSTFFFDNQEFFLYSKPRMMRYVIQTNFSDRYHILDSLGQGSFSKVYLVRKYSNSHHYAAKVIPKKDKTGENTKNCVEEQKKILEKLFSHPYISKIEEFYEDEDNYIFVLEYLPGKDLMTMFNEKANLQTDEVLALLRKILEALAFSHSHNIIHRDLKPQNIIINVMTNEPCLIDFGLGLNIFPETKVNQFKRCGTMGYMAPEVLENTCENRKKYDCKCDIFSFAIITHMFLLGKNPLKCKTYQQTFNKNLKCDIQFDEASISERYGKSYLNFLQRSLSKDSRKRPTAAEVLEMEFIKGRDSSQSTNSKTKGPDSNSCKKTCVGDMEIESPQMTEKLGQPRLCLLRSSQF